LLFVEKDLILQEPTPLIGIENKIIVIHIFFYLFHGPGEDPPFSALLSLLEVIIFSSVWFFMKKPVQTGLAWFFAGLARFFPVWVRFGFRLIKPKPNRPVFSKF